VRANACAWTTALTRSTQRDAGFERRRKATRRDMFLAEMDHVVPWSAPCVAIERHYPKEPVGGGRVRWA